VSAPRSARARAAALIGAPLRLFPSEWRRRAVQVILHSTAGEPPREAMRALLEIERDVDAYINQVALPYGGGLHVKQRLINYDAFFLSNVKAGERVLDVGSGWGNVAHAVAAAGAFVTGLDASAERVREAAARFNHPRLEFVVGTAPNDTPVRHFDVIIASNVLEHVDKRREFLQVIQQRTSADRWLIRVPMVNRDWHVPLRDELGLFSFGDPTHFTEYTERGFQEEMAGAGFRIRHLQINWGEIWAEVAYGAA
jgi:SAM-dependent methyltransferase